MTKLKDTSPKIEALKRGAAHELLACAWLLSKGYEVFRNVSVTGPVDLVAIKGDEKLLIDVKTAQRYVRLDGSVRYNFPKPSPDQIERGIKFLVAYEGAIMGYLEDLELPDRRKLA